MQKWVSVIIPTYNREQYLKRAIDSVLAQTFKNFELIVIDDGSTDNTEALIQEYPQIRYVKTQNRGVAAARNFGVQQASYDYIAFLDSDDEWLPQKLEKQIAFMTHYPEITLVHGEEIWIRNDVRVNAKNKHKKGGDDQFIPSLYQCVIGPSVALLNKKVFQDLGGFPEDYPCCEDYHLWLKWTHQYPVGFIADNLINKYGGHADQLSTTTKSIDYWRVKSLVCINENRELSKERSAELLKVLKTKCEILLKGFEKHQNFNDAFHEVKSIYQAYFS